MLTEASLTIDTDTFELLKDLMDDEGFQEIIDFFCTDTTDALKNIRIAIQNKNVDYIGSACHKLKSSSKLIGAFPLAELSSRLEQVTQLDPAGTRQATQLATQLEQEFLRITSWLANQDVMAAQ